MRKLAILPTATRGIRRLMVDDSPDGVYLYLWCEPDEGPCNFDQWFESVRDADRVACVEYGVQAKDWLVVAEPAVGANRDRVD